jgi:hypothetical protein
LVIKRIAGSFILCFCTNIIVFAFASRFFIIVVASFLLLLCHTSSSLSLCFLLLYFSARTIINMHSCYIFSEAWCYVFCYASCCIFVFLHGYFVSLHFGKNNCNVKTTIIVVQFHLLLLILAMKIMFVYKYLLSFYLNCFLWCSLSFYTRCILCVWFSFFSLVLVLCLFHLKLVGDSINFNFNHMASTFEICEAINLVSLIRELVLNVASLKLTTRRWKM